MISILGAILFAIIAILTLLVILGLPLGQFTLGGKYKILPPKMRIASGISFFIQILAIVVVLQTGGIITTFIPFKVAKGICFFFATYLVLNSIMNFSSGSKKEKLVMTPLSVIASICFWITALGIWGYYET